jgi:hypothetical protein
MLNGHHNLDGEHGIELTAYMYGELDQNSRTAFESHLAVCDECAMELASFADARLGVIEWRREAFDHLATPVILLPESEPVAPFVDKPATAGGFVGLWESLLSWPVRAGTGLAAAALLAGAVYFAAFSSGTSNGEVAAVPTNGPVAEKLPQIEPEQKTSAVISTGAPVVQPKRLSGVKSEKPIERRAARRIQLASSRTPGRSPAVIRSGQPKVQTATTRAPRLNNLDEDEDKSLRLADLFAEIGSSEE